MGIRVGYDVTENAKNKRVPTGVTRVTSKEILQANDGQIGVSKTETMAKAMDEGIIGIPFRKLSSKGIVQYLEPFLEQLDASVYHGDDNRGTLFVTPANEDAARELLMQVCELDDN